jgi:hypothetical protein
MADHALPVWLSPQISSSLLTTHATSPPSPYSRSRATSQVSLSPLSLLVDCADVDSFLILLPTLLPSSSPLLVPPTPPQQTRHRTRTSHSRCWKRAALGEFGWDRTVERRLFGRQACTRIVSRASRGDRGHTVARGGLGPTTTAQHI